MIVVCLSNYKGIDSRYDIQMFLANIYALPETQNLNILQKGIAEMEFIRIFAVLKQTRCP